MDRERPHTYRRALMIAVGIVLLLAAGWWGPFDKLRARFKASQDRGKAHTSPALHSQPAPRPADSGADRSGQALLEDMRLALLARAPGNDSRPSLANLQQALRRLPAEEASRLLRDFLATGRDAPTGAGFKVGAGGQLSAAPTLRTFLLDQLGQIDPAGAAAQARQLLEAMTSPDEWALALRNLARHDLSEAGRLHTTQKLQAMLAHEPWLREPSVGFLESFDVAVHLRDTTLVPTLTDLVRRKDNQGVAHAAYLALDRLTIVEPVATLAALQANPESMTGRELTRANYFARADVRDDAQRKLIEDYLLRPTLGAEELGGFAGLYPSANFMVSHNLLTTVQTPDRAWLAGRDRAALQQVQVWMQDERFERLKPHLRDIERRLQAFVQQTTAAQ